MTASRTKQGPKLSSYARHPGRMRERGSLASLRALIRDLRVIPGGPGAAFCLAAVVFMAALLSACSPAQTPPASFSPIVVPTASPTPVPAQLPTGLPTRPIDPSFVRILFIGSSHVTLHDLPGMLTKLAQAGGYQLHAEMYATPWISLEDHATDPDTFRAIGREPWDYVVLQDDFNTAADPAARELHMIPPAQTLDNAVKFVGARTIFFMTWGDPRPILEGQLESYLEQQRRIAEGYIFLGRRVGSLVAPVGLAVERVLQERPDLYLWLEDDEYGHANELGSYLAACVHYALIYNQSPEGLSYLVEPEEAARFMQRIAAEVVLGAEH